LKRKHKTGDNMHVPTSSCHVFYRVDEIWEKLKSDHMT